MKRFHAHVRSMTLGIGPERHFLGDSPHLRREHCLRQRRRTPSWRVEATDHRIVLYANAIFEQLMLPWSEGAIERASSWRDRIVANRQYNVLFLCSGNSARSILAESAINRWGKGKFRGFSAGSHPKGAIHPLTLELLAELKYETKYLRSKSWDEFTAFGSPRLDFVFTVCDQAAAEPCPVWPGQPITAHWGVADPAAFEGTEEQKRRFFSRIYRELENRIKIFTSLRIDALDRFALQQRVKEIGRRNLPDSWER